MIDRLTRAKQREVAIFLKRQRGLDFSCSERYINVLKRTIPENDSAANERVSRALVREAGKLTCILAKATEFDGLEHSDIHLCQKEFRMNCDLAGVDAATALSAAHMVFGVAARQYFVKERNHLAGIGDARKKLRERLVVGDEQDSQATAWKNLLLDSFRREHPDAPENKLLERLMAIATAFQDPLNRDRQNDKNLLIALKRAVKGGSFSRALWYNPPKSSQEEIVHLKLAASMERVHESDIFRTANHYERKK
ncbi:hypothetical protein FVE85_8740 [Porphyridium purpureum]|uniref:Uncharacterized protein n=1 Tax=Porphyridium purpureum TaxID=35688 RepID=A0A5J4YQ14_PORPP|nr:hypothetical protein FVE85_8740 [Porphyridium purpureum]|eukprot:POR6320..scf296_7